MWCMVQPFFLRLRSVSVWMRILVQKITNIWSTELLQKLHIKVWLWHYLIYFDSDDDITYLVNRWEAYTVSKILHTTNIFIDHSYSRRKFFLHSELKRPLPCSINIYECIYIFLSKANLIFMMSLRAAKNNWLWIVPPVIKKTQVRGILNTLQTFPHNSDE